MKLYQLKNYTKLQFIEVVLLILISFSPLISNELKAVLSFLLVVSNIKVLFNKINGKKIFLFLLAISLFILCGIYDFRNVYTLSEYSILNLFFPLCFILGFIISEKYNYYEFLTIIEKLVFIFSIFSLIGVLLYTFFPNLIDFLPSYQYYHTNNKTAYLFNIRFTDGGTILHRNSGIAWEPGAFQFLVNMGLYSYIKTTKKVNIIKVAIYSLVLITTKSTAGIIIFMIITFKLFLIDKKARIVIVLSILLFSSFIGKEIAYQFRFKLFGSYAFNTRLEPLLNAFLVGKNQLLGFGNTGYNQLINTKNVDTWDSFGQVFIRYGYPMLIIILSTLLKILKSDKFLLIIICVTFLSQGIWFLPLVTPFYYMFYNKK